MTDVGGDNHAAPRHFVADQLGREVFALRDALHFASDSALAGVMDLSANRVTLARRYPLASVHVLIIGGQHRAAEPAGARWAEVLGKASLLGHGAIGDNREESTGMSIAPDGTPVTKSELKAELKLFEEHVVQRFDTTAKELRDYIDERTRDLQTEVLRAFGDYQQAQTTRFRHMKADLGNLNTATDERLAALEMRVANFEKRLIEKGF